MTNVLFEGHVLLSEYAGRRVADIEGCVSTEFGDDIPVFKIWRIHFEDGSTEFVEGEHDIAYIPDAVGLGARAQKEPK